MGKKIIINIGDIYGRLTILQEEEKQGHYRCFKCKCICGKTSINRLSSLRNGTTKSCGCLQDEQKLLNINRTTHGMRWTNIYNVWRGLKQRCTNPKNRGYKNYGGRGITYDKKWEQFEGFYKDMGKSYKDGLTIDRIDVNGNYCKENCRWATWLEQASNKQNTLYYEGIPLIIWCRKLNIPYQRVHQRIQRGSSYMQALELESCADEEYMNKIDYNEQQ